MADNTQYYVTEKEVSQLLRESGLPDRFQRLFAKDYVAIKRDFNGTVTDLTNLTTRVLSAETAILVVSRRVGTVEGQITDLTLRLDNVDILLADFGGRIEAIEIDLAQFHIDFDDHVNATEAHGSTGPIVGTGNFCTPSVGGTVLQAGAVTDSVASTVSVTSTPTVAGASYSQATATTWVNMLNELKADVNQLVTDLNAIVTTVNQSLATERTANQRAP